MCGAKCLKLALRKKTWTCGAKPPRLTMRIFKIILGCAYLALVYFLIVESVGEQDVPV